MSDSSMQKPVFSCVVPVKGPRPFMDKALASLSGQGMNDALEVVIQDGDVEPDSGQSDALNKGFAKAKGEWLFWLNADDILLPDALNKVGQFISHHIESKSLNWIAGDTVYVDENERVLEVRTDAKWRSWLGKKLSVWTGGPSAFFRRDLWARHGGFDIGLKYAMDIDLWTRWGQVGERFVGLGDYVWGFRLHDKSTTGSGRYAAEQAKELAEIDARYGVSTMNFWRNISRIASLVDGTWAKRRHDTLCFKGKLWWEMLR